MAATPASVSKRPQPPRDDDGDGKAQLAPAQTKYNPVQFAFIREVATPARCGICVESSTWSCCDVVGLGKSENERTRERVHRGEKPQVFCRL